MKCDRCKNLNTDKGLFPCSTCEHRPHDFCTRNNFEPAEPKVLTTDEWTAKNIPSNFHRDIHEFIEKACEFFQQNGRLERDLELRPLVKAIFEPVEIKCTVDDWYGKVISVARNLKPLKG